MDSGRALFPELYLVHCPLICAATNYLTYTNSLTFQHEQDISKNYVINRLSKLISSKPLFNNSVAMSV